MEKQTSNGRFKKQSARGDEATIMLNAGTSDLWRKEHSPQKRGERGEDAEILKESLRNLRALCVSAVNTVHVVGAKGDEP